MIHSFFTYPAIKNILTIAIAFVWFINGMFCKVLNFVPRHQLIVAYILGRKNAVVLTKIIGLMEVMITLWIVSGFKYELCAIIQISTVAAMNIIEFMVVPHLLLFGRRNIVVASFFIVAVYYNAFVLPNFMNK